MKGGFLHLKVNVSMRVKYRVNKLLGGKGTLAVFTLLFMLTQPFLVQGTVFPQPRTGYHIKEARVNIDLADPSLNVETWLFVQSEMNNLSNFTVYLHAINPTNISTNVYGYSIVKMFNPFLKVNQTFIKLDVREQLMKGEITKVRVSFASKESAVYETYLRRLNISDASWKELVFMFFTPNISVYKLSIEILMPEKSSLKAPPNFPPLMPWPTINYTVGTREKYVWEFRNITDYEIVRVYYYKQRKLVNGGTNKPNQNVFWSVAALATVSVAVALTALFMVIGKRREVIKTMLLSPEEEKLIRILREEGGKVEQRVLPSRMGLSKSTISKIVSRLEGKGVLKKQEYGRTNLIVLKREIKV